MGFSTSLSAGSPGVLVWHDSAPLAQPNIIEESRARLAGFGRVLIEDSHIVRATVNNLPTSDSTLLNVTTTVGNEVVDCEVSGHSAKCAGILKGEALLGGSVFLANGGIPLASGKIVRGNGGFGDDDHGDRDDRNDRGEHDDHGEHHGHDH